MANHGSTYSFVSTSFVGILDMLVGSLDFDLIVAIPMRHSIVDNIMFRGCLVMTGYREMSIDFVLLDFQDFHVILRIDLLASYYGFFFL